MCSSDLSVETILTLCCARCLQQFNHALNADVRELIAFQGGPDPEDDWAALPGNDLDDRLDPRGRFDPERWLFEQLSLRLPLVNRCGEDCPGPARWSTAPPAVDPRWAALQGLGASSEDPDPSPVHPTPN